MDDENYTISTNRDLFTWQLEKTFNARLTGKIFGGYTFLKRYNFDDSSVISVSPLTSDRAVLNAAYTGKNLTNEFQLNYNLSRLRLTGGLGYHTDRMNVKSSYYNYAFGFGSESNYDTVGIKTNTAFGYGYADYSIPVGRNKFHLAGGARLTNNSRFGNYVTYEVAPSFVINENASLFITYATGFNAPSLYQLFAPEKDFTSGITRGFGGLEPEQSSSLEAGTKINLKKNASIRLSVYTNTVDNVIEYVYLWNGSKPVNTLNFTDFRGDTYLNVGKQVNIGIETGADVYPNPHWEMHFNMAYNHGELNYDASTLNKVKTLNNHVQLYSNGVFLQSSKEDKTIRRPSLMSNASLVYKTKSKWRFTLDARYVGKRKDVFYDWTLGPYGALGKTDIADYTLWNIAAYYRISRRFSASASVFNLFDRHYTELSGFTTRPRMGLLTLQVSL
jgi:vitamin B12 transporter